MSLPGSSGSLSCAGCQRTLEVGDNYIKGTTGETLGQNVAPEIDSLIADIMGSGLTGRIVYCEDCTQDGGNFLLETVYGDE